jgi:hypothetical protein
MKELLTSVDNRAYVVERFYPIVVRRAANQTINGEEIVTMFVEAAIDEFARSQLATIQMLRAGLKQYI